MTFCSKMQYLQVGQCNAGQHVTSCSVCQSNFENLVFMSEPNHPNLMVLVWYIWLVTSKLVRILTELATCIIICNKLQSLLEKIGSTT